MSMARLWWVSCLPFLLLCLLFCSTSSAQQLSQSQKRSLFRLQRILEYPAAFHGWDNRTNPCALPPSPVVFISCSGNRVTELSINGDASVRLSSSFSIDALFTTLSRLPNLTSLSLVSLGLWGPISSKVDRLEYLRVLNLSANYISGSIPVEVSTMATLQSLVLDGNQIDGTVPEIGSLRELSVAGNRLGPAFPALGDGVVSVVLRNNSFRSSIPVSVQRLRKLERLDLSSNLFQGPVPAFLFSLPAIQHLDLSQNHLTGSLPSTLSCPARLGFVDVSGNRLVGNLPACISSNTTSMTVLDAGNCLSSGDPTYQHPNSYCNEGAIAAVIPSDPAVPNASPQRKKNKDGNKLGLVLGIVGGVVGGAVVLGLLLVVVAKRARMDEAEAGGFLPKTAAGKALSVHASPGFPADARHMNQAVRMGTLGLLPPYRVFSVEELEEATDSFDATNLIRRDPGSQMYRGWLRDGSTVIVRCLKLKQKYSPQSVGQFIDAISKLRHQHLVSVLGHCVDSDQENTNSTNSLYVILEHVSNGTLRSFLTEQSKREMLKWPQRVAAVIGVARAIQFLHGITVPGNDLTIENILLDEALTAKISNYNLPMVSTNKSNKGGTESPFAATEETDVVRKHSHRVEHGEKEDAYQLGLVLLEMITGRALTTIKDLDTVKVQLQKGLKEEQEKFHEPVDPSIRGTFAHDSLSTVVEIALNCVAGDLDQRPSIDDILWNLQYSVQVQDGWTSHDSFSGLS